jgi:hypothetical protein
MDRFLRRILCAALALLLSLAFVVDGTAVQSDQFTSAVAAPKQE